METNEKIARYRLSVLELAKKLGNVSQACRERGMTRTQFYQYKKRYEQFGLEGLKNLPPVHKSHPYSTPPELARMIVALSFKHPGWGCVKISEFLKKQEISISSPTVQNILIKNKMGTRAERLLILQEKSFTEKLKLSQEQISLIEKVNPCFKEADSGSSCPGEKLIQSSIRIAKPFKLEVQIVIDTYNNYVFGFLDLLPNLNSAVDLIKTRVVPFYKNRGIVIKSILTDNGKQYFEGSVRSYQLCLAANGIEHIVLNKKACRENGFLKRFTQNFLNEFFYPRLQRSELNLASLENDFERWLLYYNTERPNPVYPNWGKPPVEIVQEYHDRLKISETVS